MGVLGHQSPSHIFSRYFHGKSSLQSNDHPLAPTLIHWGGAHDASISPVQKFPALLSTANTVLSQPGRLSGGAKPRERQIFVNDFP
jgi:hypothetical protein